MRVAGIIAEYNPMHNGHALHIAKTRAAGCDKVIAVMNGSWSQRGEPMLLSKWTRTRMALACGADLVIELPALWGVRPAERFAFGGVRLLDAANCVDVLSFGCETGDIAVLERACDVLRDEPEEYAATLRKGLAAGESFARARGEALAAVTGLEADVLNGPNFALALEYMRYTRTSERPMEILPVKREVAHNAGGLAEVTSAGAIRAAVYAGGTEEACRAMPKASADLLRENAGGIVREDALDTLALHCVRALSEEETERLADAGEGVGRRLRSFASGCGTRVELLDAAKCKRYTRARLSRIVCEAILEIDRELAEACPEPGYIRVLGMRADAKDLLGILSTSAKLPVITRGAELKGDRCFETERRATDLRALLARDPAERRADSDLETRLIIV